MRTTPKQTNRTTNMSRALTTMGLTIIGSGALILGAPVMADAATTDSQSRVSVQASQYTDTDAAQINNADLTYVGGTLEGFELGVVDGGNRSVTGFSGSATSFTQDDGWNQEAQLWTGGNELVIGFDDEQFTISDLSFANGRARGHIIGAGLPDSMMDLTDANALVEIDGSSVTITAKEGRNCGEWTLRFTLTRYV